MDKPAPGKLLTVSGATRYWPDYRGVYLSHNRNAVAWCNEEDHCRIIILHRGGDLLGAFKRFR